ncbi:MAG: FAD-binding protein, partial [Candidatus Methanomethyliaceae archaeon]
RDITGKAILFALYRQAARMGCDVLHGCTAIKLLGGPSQINGVLAFDWFHGTWIPILGKSTVVATGGGGCLFYRTSNPPGSTGDGIWVAFDAGAELMDLEFIQFYPVNYVYPPSLVGRNVGSYGETRLLNSKMERFMQKYDPERLENTTRDLLARAIYTELKEGRGTEHGGVFIDRTGLPDAYYARFPQELQLCLERGLDIRTTMAEVAPAAHYFCGGIKINCKTQTNAGGLFAAGEVAAGIHGANRLANNSLTDALVFGFIAGEEAWQYALGCRVSSKDKQNTLREAKAYILHYTKKIQQISGNKSGETILSMKNRISKLMWEKVGVVREHQELQDAVNVLENLVNEWPCMVKYETSANKNILTLAIFELESMVNVAYLIALTALTRKESRGTHYRCDFPYEDDTLWRCNIVLHKKGDSNGFATSFVQPGRG